MKTDITDTQYGRQNLYYKRQLYC